MALIQHDRTVIKQPVKALTHTNKGKTKKPAETLRHPLSYYDYVAYFDGSIKKNPHGEMGFGCYLLDNEGVQIHEYASMMPAKDGNSNMVAEYLGLQSIYAFLEQEGINNARVLINGDSEFVIKQARSRFQYGRTDALYYDYMIACKEYIESTDNELHYRWIPREENTVADELSTRLVNQ